MSEVAAAASALLGRDAAIDDAQPIGGGCISPALRLAIGGERFFLKWRPAGASGAGMFAAEAHALRELAAARALRVPAVVAYSDAPDAAQGWLLLEWLPPAPASTAGWARLGRGLAALHRVRAERPGWPHDNFIGPLPQSNAASEDWPRFWRERRLRPQLERAAAAFTSADHRRFQRLFERLPELLEDAADEGWSLLHGDLWSGNVQHMPDDVAVLDPSAYYGHREVDLAMAELFGGFTAEFHAAYRDAWAPSPSYRTRRPVYQLYYLLVHVNCFGGSYVESTRAVLQEIVG